MPACRIGLSLVAPIAMTRLEITRAARKHLQKHERVSLRLLRRPCALGDDELDGLVNVQRIARHAGNVLE